MVKELKRQEHGFIQLCDCGAEHLILFSSLKRKQRLITLPLCNHCRSRIEVLNLNNGLDPHSVMVTQVFAEVGG